MAIASNGKDTPILEHLTTLSDSVRSRILVLLGQELTVGDLCAVLQLPQSTVSRHLKFLADRNWVDSRPDGTHRLYHRTLDAPGHDARGLWDMVRAAVEESSAGAVDRERLASVLASRRSRSREFFDRSAGDWDTLRDELFGPHFHGLALLGLLPASWTVADLGCGTGAVAEALAPFVREVIGVDASPAMLQGAERRLARFENVTLHAGELEHVPLADGTADAVSLMLVLHHLDRPELAVREAARIARPGGKVLIVDMLTHDRVQYRREMGHTRLGFSQEEIETICHEAGLGGTRFQPLPPAPEAKGPNLFAFTASKE